MKKILVVDDDQDLSGLIKEVLNKGGYKVLISLDPKTGLDIARQERPDLILMDVMLPGMNGAEMVKILKSESMLRDIPIIFLTGLLSNNEKYNGEAGIKVGEKYYVAIAKPFEIKDLLAKVKGIIG